MGTEHCTKWHSGRHAGRQTLVAYYFGRADSQKVVGPLYWYKFVLVLDDKQISDYPISCLSWRHRLFFCKGVYGLPCIDCSGYCFLDVALLMSTVNTLVAATLILLPVLLVCRNQAFIV